MLSRKCSVCLSDLRSSVVYTGAAGSSVGSGAGVGSADGEGVFTAGVKDGTGVSGAGVGEDPAEKGLNRNRQTNTITAVAIGITKRFSFI